MIQTRVPGEIKNLYDHPHPGRFIRMFVIPAHLSVTQAAAVLGVGRPALSNMLNGNAGVSVEMAIRLESAFGASAVELVIKQALHDLRVAKDSR